MGYTESTDVNSIAIRHNFIIFYIVIISDYIRLASLMVLQQATSLDHPMGRGLSAPFESLDRALGGQG